MENKYDVGQLQIGQPLYFMDERHSKRFTVSTYFVTHIGPNSAIVGHDLKNSNPKQVWAQHINTFPIEHHIGFETMQDIPGDIREVNWFISKDDADKAANHINNILDEREKQSIANWEYEYSFNNRVRRLGNKIFELNENKENKKLVMQLEELLND